MSSKIERISAATIHLIHESGLQSVSMAQIAQRANVAVGTIYNYYASKEELISGIYSHYMEALATHCIEYYRAEGSIKKRFFSLNRGLMDYLLNNPIIFHFIDDYYTSPYICQEAKDKLNPYLDLMKVIHTELTEQNKIKDFSLDFFILAITGSINSIIRGYHDGNITGDIFTIETQIISGCWDGIAKVEYVP